jgi:cell division protein FtsL
MKQLERKKQNIERSKIELWEKIKRVLSWIGSIAILIVSYLLFFKKTQKPSDIDKAKTELNEIQKKIEEEKRKLEDALQAIRETQKQTDEEVENAKENVEVPSDPSSVADAYNDLLERIHGRGESRSDQQQNCDGCAGRN